MNKAQTFFFYDYESFGINPASDRPAQFAGIRTDGDFAIIGDPVMFYCKQTPDYLPAPEAVLVTGITPQLCNEKGLAEPEFAARIHAEFSRPNTCIIGYNNIRYDDEMTRYTLFRNFFDPYEYSWKNGNSRWDLLDVVRACYALRPDGIEWVFDENGVPNFKLENLTKANGIAHESAHDAMSDVYATIAMTKLIKEKQPKLFEFFFTHRGKKEIEKMIDVGEMTPLVHVSGMFGNVRGNTAWIAPIAWHPTQQNQVICCDLSGETESLLNESAETLKIRLYTKREALGEGVAPVPLKGVHINKCPILAPAKVLSPENAERLGINREKCLQNLKVLKKHKSLVREKVIEIFMEERVFAPSPNVETRLYEGFFSEADKNNMAILRGLAPHELANHGLQFADPRVEPLLFHYRARHFPQTLTRAEQVKWRKYCTQQLEAKAEAFEASVKALFQAHHDEPEKVKLLENLTAYAAQISEAPYFQPSDGGQNERLLTSLNEVAARGAGKAEKFKMLKELIK